MCQLEEEKERHSNPISLWACVYIQDSAAGASKLLHLLCLGCTKGLPTTIHRLRGTKKTVNGEKMVGKCWGNIGNKGSAMPISPLCYNKMTEYICACVQGILQVESTVMTNTTVMGCPHTSVWKCSQAFFTFFFLRLTIPGRSSGLHWRGGQLSFHKAWLPLRELKQPSDTSCTKKGRDHE